MLPLDITHNATMLQLPAAGGQLSYRAEGRESREVPLPDDRRVAVVTGLQPGTKYTFSWRGDAGKKALRVETRPGCVTNTSSHAIGETYHMGCQSTCVCGGANQPSCRPRCTFTRGTVTDLSCSERPDLDDPECCVQLVCAVTSSGGRIVDDLLESTTAKETTTPEPTTTTTTTTTTDSSSRAIVPGAEADEVDSGAPAALLAADQQPKHTMIVTTKSFSSVTLAWDDFKPPAYARGYVAQYRRTGSEEWRRQELPPQPGRSVPLMKIEELVPSTEYEARVAIYDSRDQDTLGDTTETIRFTTDDGCVDGNGTFPVGGQFHRGCEQTCFCELRGKVRCVPRCQRPMFRQGFFRDDPLCFEKRMDECCVIAACASAAPTDSVVEADGLDPCESVLCDENYVCELMTKDSGDVTAMAMCVCPPGFTERTDGDSKTCRPEAKTPPAVIVTGCTYGNATYQPGDEFFDGCEYKCMCNSEEEIECQARCSSISGADAALAAGCRLAPDPADDCCQKTVCDTDTESATTSTTVSPDLGCENDGQQHPTNSTFDRGCERCFCEGRGQLSCKSRCAPQKPPAGASCTSRPDPADPCCNITVCMPAELATTTSIPETGAPAALQTRFGGARLEKAPALRITELRPVTVSSSELKLLISDAVLDSILSATTQPLLVEWRYDDAARWRSSSIGVDDFSVESLDTLVMTVEGLERPRQARVRVSYAGEMSAVVQGEDVVPLDATLPPPQTVEVTTEDTYGETVASGPAAAALEFTPAPEITTLRPEGCFHDGTLHKVGDEFYDGCSQFCICGSAGKMCAPIRCPVRFGLDLINPDCLEWEVPRDPSRQPPDCCGEAVCKDDGHCVYQGQEFRNQYEIPQNLTGCHQRCYCEYGTVSCQPDCPPVPELPPTSLQCAAEQAELVTGPNGCCQFWQCATPDPPTTTTTTTAGPEPTIPSDLMLEDVVVEAVDPSSIQLNFTLPPQFVGLAGKTEILYTDSTALLDSEGNLASWDRRMFVTPSGRLDSADYSWTLGDLAADTHYLLQTRVVFDEGTTDLDGGMHEAETPPQPTPGTTLPPKVALDAALVATDINTTWARIGWRRLNETELRYIDGIQLRYRDVDVDAQVWTMTPFIHRELTQYELTDLKPGTGYEVDIVLMPFQDKNTEMVSERPLGIRTLPVVDPYDFNLTLTLAEVKPSSVRVEWSGIPDPQYKYVNVYRIVYIYEKEREEKHTFKLAKTSDTPSLLLKGLKPSRKYQVWLEAYLKNGKKRVSEVQEFDTKPGEIGKAEEIKGDEKEPDTTLVAGAATYFSGMVVAAIIAALAILLAIVCAVCLVRKSSHAKAPITSARKNGPSYENPAFKPSNSFEAIRRENSDL